MHSGVFHSQMSGRRVEHVQLLERVYHLNGPAAPTDTNGQPEPDLLIDHVKELEGPPIYYLVELQVDGLDVVWIFDSQQFPLASRRT